MKNLLLITLLVLSFKATAQPHFDAFVFGFGFDPKMAIVGAHPDRPDNKPSFDWEASIGFDWEHVRLLMQVKSHKEVNFFKWTYMQFDYKLNPEFWLFGKQVDNLYIYSGLEMSQIGKKHPDFHYKNVDNYREVTINPIMFGANFEVQMKFLDNSVGLGAQFSIYQSEDELKPYKKYRKEGTINLYIYL